MANPHPITHTAAAVAVGPVRYRFGTWVVTDDGIACLVHRYPLSHARRAQAQDWPRHLPELPWVNVWDLLRAVAVVQAVGPHPPRPGPQGEAAHPS
jgi:hypothetical protein